LLSGIFSRKKFTTWEPAYLRAQQISEALYKYLITLHLYKKNVLLLIYWKHVYPKRLEGVLLHNLISVKIQMKKCMKWSNSTCECWLLLTVTDKFDWFTIHYIVLALVPCTLFRYGVVGCLGETHTYLDVEYTHSYCNCFGFLLGNIKICKFILPVQHYR